MLRMDRRLLQNVDWLLLGAALFIIGLSLVCLWSLNPGRGISALMWRQLSWVGVGLVGLLVVVSVDYRNLVRFAPVFYVIGVGLLLSVFMSAVQGVFNAALYRYACFKQVPPAFDHDLVASAWAPKS